MVIPSLVGAGVSVPAGLGGGPSPTGAFQVSWGRVSPSLKTTHSDPITGGSGPYLRFRHKLIHVLPLEGLVRGAGGKGKEEWGVIRERYLKHQAPRLDLPPLEP